MLVERGDDAIKAIMGLTDGIGADAVLECVGTNEANQTTEVYPTAALSGRTTSESSLTLSRTDIKSSTEYEWSLT